jgi:hypothetical protein
MQGAGPTHPGPSAFSTLEARESAAGPGRSYRSTRAEPPTVRQSPKLPLLCSLCWSPQGPHTCPGDRPGGGRDGRDIATSSLPQKTGVPVSQSFRVALAISLCLSHLLTLRGAAHNSRSCAAANKPTLNRGASLPPPAFARMADASSDVAEAGQTLKKLTEVLRSLRGVDKDRAKRLNEEAASLVRAIEKSLRAVELEAKNAPPTQRRQKQEVLAQLRQELASRRSDLQKINDAASRESLVGKGAQAEVSACSTRATQRGSSRSCPLQSLQGAATDAPPSSLAGPHTGG